MYPPARNPGAEVLKWKTEKAEVLADQGEDDAVIVIVENGVAIQREGGFFCDQIFVMQVFDATKGAAVESLPLNRLVRIARGPASRRWKVRSNILQVLVPPSNTAPV